jgi:hypothetical protein
VVSQQFAKSVERCSIDAPAGLEVGDPATNVQMVDEDAHDVGVVGPGVTGEGRQEQLLLQAEVLTTLLAPEAERRMSHGLQVGIGRALQLQGKLERDVVLA